MTIVSVEKQISITYTECVFVALSIYHAILMSHVICGLPGSTIFFHISHKRHDFRKQLLDIKCVLIFARILSVIFLILSRTERDIIMKVQRSSCKESVILVRF